MPAAPHPFGVRLHQNSIVCHPAADIAGRLCRINAEYRTETGFAGLGAGHCHNYAMLPAVLIEGIYRLRQIYAVQDLKACRIAGTNAEDHEIFALGPDVIHFDLLAVYLKVDHIFYLREEKSFALRTVLTASDAYFVFGVHTVYFALRFSSVLSATGR